MKGALCLQCKKAYFIILASKVQIICNNTDNAESHWRIKDGKVCIEIQTDSQIKDLLDIWSKVLLIQKSIYFGVWMVAISTESKKNF